MKNIFDTVEIKNLHLKNRLIRSATWEGIADFDGSISDDTYEIYHELAKDGVGTIITGFTSVAANDFYFGGMMRLSDNKLIPQYKKLVEIIHAENCAAIAQLALGAFYDKNFVEVAENDLSTDDVREIIKMFVDAVVRAKILIDILRGIKTFAPKLHVTIKINSSDFTNGGLNEEESLEICKLLAAAGIDSIEVSGNGTSVG